MHQYLAAKNPDFESFAKYINRVEDVQAVEALFRTLDSPRILSDLVKPIGPDAPMVHVIAALYFLSSIFASLRRTSETTSDYTPFTKRCYEMLIENWPHVLKWIKLLLMCANNTTNPTARLVNDCARTMNLFLEFASEDPYRQELLSMSCTCDVLFQLLYITHGTCGAYFICLAQKDAELSCYLLTVFSRARLQKALSSRGLVQSIEEYGERF
jgi:hypothetical protein